MSGVTLRSVFTEIPPAYSLAIRDPNLSVMGSLATILWLVALRCERVHVRAWSFLRIGVIVTMSALLLALASLAL